MKTNEKQQEQQRQLHSKLWSIANDLRGNMEGNEFKNYILGLIFYRYLSEKVESRVNDLLSEDDIDYLTAWQDEEYKEGLKEELLEQIGYFIEPTYLFSNLVNSIENANFDIEMLQKAINSNSLSPSRKQSPDWSSLSLSSAFPSI